MGTGNCWPTGQSAETGSKSTEEQDLRALRHARICDIQQNPVNKKASATGILARPQTTVEHPSALDDLWGAWASHRDKLLNHCTRIMSGDVADAEDALGDALLRAATHFKDGRGSGIRDPRAWLSRLAHNSCVDFIRVRASQRRRSEQVMGMGEVSPTVPAPIHNPEAVMLANDALRQLGKALDELPDVLRETFALRFVEGLAYAEIASRLHVSDATARKRIQLARDRLRGYRSAAPH
ncbi:MAG: RNA polymerase sigma factor [Nisaea sp.]|uniref:RNA polymerase sigma factor n=1 Tax=Nisaea sp. TaxID=2024842 RepID=UPI001B2330DD|nr:RNA polymerase sigma factor [Nisaea sp.]